MSDATERHVVEGEVMLDNLIWRRYRRPTPDLVEKTLDLNPGLAGLGPFLPRGTVVNLPIVATEAVTVRPVVKLWS